MGKLFISGLIAVLLISVACGGSSSPVTPAISDGSWSGTLQGGAVTFTVDDSQVKDMHVTFVYWGQNLPADTLIWTPDNTSISDNKFNMSDTLSNGYYSYSMSINGTFDPPSGVSGMFGTEGAYDSLGTHYTTSDSISWSGAHQ